jgi:hypothetical protein
MLGLLFEEYTTMKKLALVLALGTSLTWAQWEHFPVWFETSTINYPIDCELNSAGTVMWVGRNRSVPTKIDLSNTEIRTYPPFSTFYPTRDQYPRGIAIKPGTDTVFAGGDLGRVWKGDDSTFVRLADIPHTRTINDLEFDVYGKLWAATDSLVWRWDGSSWTPMGTAADYGSNPKSTQLAADPRGGMWIASEGRGLLLHKQGAFARQFDLFDIGIKVAGNGTVLVNRYGSLVRIPYNSNTTEEIPDSHISGDEWSGAGFEDAEGGIWIAHGRSITHRTLQGVWSIDSAATRIDANRVAGVYRFVQASNGTLYACGRYRTLRLTRTLPLHPTLTPDPEDSASVPTLARHAAQAITWTRQGNLLSLLPQHQDLRMELRRLDGGLVAPPQSAPLALPPGTHILRITQGGKTLQSAKVVSFSSARIVLLGKLFVVLD